MAAAAAARDEPLPRWGEQAARPAPAELGAEAPSVRGRRSMGTAKGPGRREGRGWRAFRRRRRIAGERMGEEADGRRQTRCYLVFYRKDEEAPGTFRLGASLPAR